MRGMEVYPLDAVSDVPPYEQLRVQIASRAASGELPAGTRLPTVRALAAELHLAVNTVAKAYRALETDGVVATEGRRGTFVASTTDARPPGTPRRRTPPSPAARASPGRRRSTWSRGAGDLDGK
jgi:DNA-binding transcriptional regulator YhcF (GntR family)